jgi:predicted RNA binding protein YcfA (HicA-like mRNA interferase family)
MANIDKLILKLNSKPKDFTWNELVKVLAHYGYTEIASKGKTGGSRRKFKNDKKDIINLHKPHPGNILLEYAIKQVLEKLK